MNSLNWILLFLLLPFEVYTFGKIPRILQDISSHKDLNQFGLLLRQSEPLRRILQTRELTIFAPTDAAFDKFQGRMDDHLLLYHLLPLALTVEGLLVHADQKHAMQCYSDQLPSVWLKVEAGKLYVNDAEVLRNESDYHSRTREDFYGSLQIMHKVNKVLSPMTLPTTQSMARTAYDLLAQPSNWPQMQYVLNNYYRRVIMTNSASFYKDLPNPHTFVIPADEFRTPLEDAAINQHAINCSIIPDVVFITSTLGSKAFKTISRNCEIIFDGKQIESQNILHHHRKVIKILLGNIPLNNGVAHIVNHMPGVFHPQMAPWFPIRSLWGYVNNDYDLQTQTALMEPLTNVLIQNLRNDNPRNLTIFVVNDMGWERFLVGSEKSEKDLLKNRNLERFMMRHISEEIYDTQRLLDVTKLSLRGQPITLGLGDTKVIVKVVQDGEDGKSVAILWGVKKIKIVKANIKCSNGILHVIDAPFIFNREINDEGLNWFKLWKTLSAVMY